MIYIIVLLIIILLFTRIKLNLQYGQSLKVYLLIGKIFKKKLTIKQSKKPSLKNIKILMKFIDNSLKYITIDKINIKLWYLILDDPYVVFCGYMLLNSIRYKCHSEFKKVKHENFELKYNNLKHSLELDILISISIGELILLLIINLPKLLLLIKKEKKYERISNN